MNFPGLDVETNKIGGRTSKIEMTSLIWAIHLIQVPPMDDRAICYPRTKILS